MTKSIENLVSFPVNAQRNSFFGALSSILLYRHAYTEDTPFFCGKHQRNCIRCGGCGNEPYINKHHLKIEANVLFDRIKRSIEEKQPVLIKLSLGDLWAVITGYDDDKNLPYLMKSRRSPQLDKDWYNKLTNIVFITDQYDSTISLSESLNHMIHHLNTSSRNKLEQKIYQKLETEPDVKNLASG